MNNIFYDIEDNCYRTYPDGDRANNKEIHKSIQKLQKENQELKKQQKEFIEYLKQMLDSDDDNFSVVRVRDILSKYKEIVRGKNGQ